MVAGALLAGCGAVGGHSGLAAPSAVLAASRTKPQSCPANSKRLDRPSFDHPLAASRTYPTLAAASSRLSFEPVVARALGTPVGFDSSRGAIAIVYGGTCARRFVVVEAASPKVPDGGLASARRITNSLGSTIAWNQHGITFTVSGPAPFFTMRKAERIAHLLSRRA